MRGVWGDGKRIFGSEMAMPKPPRDVFETSTVLDGLFAFCKDWIEKGGKKVRREKRERREEKRTCPKAGNGISTVKVLDGICCYREEGRWETGNHDMEIL